MKRDQLAQKILRDCHVFMRPTVMLYSAENIFSGALSVYTASILSVFADAVFALDFSLGMPHFWRLLLCIGLNVIAVPLIGTLGEVAMLSNALKHDRRVLERVLDKSYDEMMKIEEGDVQYRLEDDINSLRQIWVNISVKAIVTPLVLTYLLIYTLRINALYTTIVFLISLIHLIVPFAVKKWKALYDQQTREYNSQVRIWETELTTKAHMIQLYGMQKAILDKFKWLYQTYYDKILSKSIRCNAAAEGISGFLSSICVFIIILAGAIMTAKGMITAGAVAGMVGYFSVFNILTENISFIIQKRPILGNLVDRVKKLYEGAERQDGLVITSVCEIEADKLSFAWEDKVIFQNLGFKIRKGSKAAVCGPNGSGKSTLFKILCGLYKEYGGHILLDKRELSDVNLDSWRSLVAYVPQDPYLFTGTVRENIALGNPEADEEMVTGVMQQVKIENLAERRISMNQGELSGGERQKISVARALIKQTPILLMDEPSNHMDEQTVNWLYELIQNTPQTVLYISHNPDLISEKSERIIVAPYADRLRKQ